MTENGKTCRLLQRQDLLFLAILVIIALGLGVYLIATTVLIAEDGVSYIERAQKLSNNPTGLIKRHPPGYPALIFAAYKIAVLFIDNPSNSTWLYSAQGVALLCRLFTIIPMYLIGKRLIGSRQSFWAMLILVLLPYPTEFGSDALRDWPHMMFLAWGMLFLIAGAQAAKWWLFGLAGVFSGLGHMVRPECVQIVIYGILWLLLIILNPHAGISKLKTVYLMLAICVGYAVAAAPYIKIRGTVLPSELQKVIYSKTCPDENERFQADLCDSVMASFIPASIWNATIRYVQEISDNLMYIFVLPLVLGFREQHRKLKNILFTDWFFIIALSVLYPVMMIALELCFNYMSRRHCLPAALFVVYYIPAGLAVLARKIKPRDSNDDCKAEQSARLWFFILLTIGLAVCGGRFVMTSPIRWEKAGYRGIAEWINKNTPAQSVIEVPDKRIAFYADRRAFRMVKNQSRRPDYMVKIVAASQENTMGDDIEVMYSEWVNQSRRDRKIMVCRTVP